MDAHSAYEHDFEMVQTLLDDFFCILVNYYTTGFGFAHYVHIIQCHLVDCMKDTYSLAMKSNQGFENHHQEDKRIYNDGTLKGGCGTNYVLDILEHHFLKLALRQKLAVELEEQYKKTKMTKKKLKTLSRVFGPWSKDPAKKQASFRYFFLKKLVPDTLEAKTNKHENKPKTPKKEAPKSKRSSALAKSVKTRSKEIVEAADFSNLEDNFFETFIAPLFAEKNDLNDCFNEYFVGDLIKISSLHNFASI